MTQTEVVPHTTESPAVQPRLRRSTQDSMIAGVCGGLGRYFDVDPLWFRLGFVAVTLAGGAGVLIYLVSWIVIAKEQPGEIIVARPEGIGAGGLGLLGVVLVGIGLMLLLSMYVPWFDQVAWPLTVVGAGVGLIYLGSRR